MFSERARKNIIALSVTIVVNFTVCISIASSNAYEALYWVGLGFAPLFGGIFRSIVAFKRDVIPIIFITAVVDAFALIPLINFVWDEWASEYGFGLIIGAIAATIMMISGFITLLIRHIIERNMIRAKQQKLVIEQNLESKN